MNHTERIAETARCHRHLNRRLVKEVVETYLDLLAEEIVEGEWVDIYGIGKMQLIIEEGSGAAEIKQHRRLRSKLRLSSHLKMAFYRRFD